MFEAIDTINSIIDGFDTAIIDIKSGLEEDNYEYILDEDTCILDEDVEMDTKYYELLVECKPHNILSSLEAIHWSSLATGSHTHVEDIYIRRIKVAFGFIIYDILKSRELIERKLINVNNETLFSDVYLECISNYLGEMLVFVDGFFENISTFYFEIHEKKIEFGSINDLSKKAVKYIDIFKAIRLADEKKKESLSPHELEFIKNLTEFGEKEGIFSASEFQLKQLACQKKLGRYGSRKIKFLKKQCRADAFRLTKVFDLSYNQANAAFDLGTEKLTKENKPKYSTDTKLDEFFKTQYEKYFKDTNSQFFTFSYCLPIK